MTCGKLKKELWSFRTSVKRLARLHVSRYHELHPDKRDIRTWISAHNLGADAAVWDVVVAIRKQAVADLTGVGDNERRANFIYQKFDVSSGLLMNLLLIYDLSRLQPRYSGLRVKQKVLMAIRPSKLSSMLASFRPAEERAA